MPDVMQLSLSVAALGMLALAVVWWRRIERFDIGRAGDVYLTRWTLLGRRASGRGQRLFLHHFHRSDGDILHDHPWAFWSLILWPGYYEETPGGRRWYGPLSLLKRKAEWTHRVVLLPGRTCWTLVWTGPKVRSWGFACPGGWIPWRKHAANTEATGHGCGVVETQGTPDSSGASEVKL